MKYALIYLWYQPFLFKKDKNNWINLDQSTALSFVSELWINHSVHNNPNNRFLSKKEFDEWSIKLL